MHRVAKSKYHATSRINQNSLCKYPLVLFEMTKIHSILLCPHFLNWWTAIFDHVQFHLFSENFLILAKNVTNIILFSFPNFFQLFLTDFQQQKFVCLILCKKSILWSRTKLRRQLNWKVTFLTKKHYIFMLSSYYHKFSKYFTKKLDKKWPKNKWYFK